LEKRAGGIPVFLTAATASEALRILAVHRVALVHPPWFSEEVSGKGRDYFRSRGFEVVSCTRISPARSFTEVPPAEVYDWAKANVPREAEALFIGGNGLRAIGVIEALEQTLARPVLTANQVLFWQALRIAGITSKVTHYGKIFAKNAVKNI
jgi:maleate isomerase